MGAWYFLIPALFATAYAVLGGIEFGLPAFGILAGRGPIGRATRTYFSPAWETTNVLLVAAFTAILTLYPSALPQLAVPLQALWLAGGSLILLRAVFVLILYYGPAATRDAAPSRAVAAALALVSLALPATLIQTVTVSLTGNGFTATPLLAAALAGMAVTMPLALAGGYLAIAQTRLRTAARWLWLVALILSQVAVPAAEHRAGLISSLIQQTFYLPLIGAVVVASTAVALRPRAGRYLAAAAVLAVGTAIQLALLQLPYLVRPTLRLGDAITNSATASIIAAGYVILLLIMLPSLWWLQRLIASQDRPTPD